MSRIRLFAALPLVAICLALLGAGCASAQARTASALAISGAGLERPLHAAETAAGRAELVRVHAAGGTRADGDSALEALEARWAPAWAALDLFLAADSAWLDAILAQEDGDWGRLVDAACGLLRAATPLAPEAIGRFAAIAAPFCPEVSP